MAKWFGNVGYSIPQETVPGVYKNTIVEKEYSGDVVKTASNWKGTSYELDSIEINRTISIIADPFAYENFSRIIYVEYMNSKWKVKSAEPQYPRIQLTIGGVYNEKPSGTS